MHDRTRRCAGRILILGMLLAVGVALPAFADGTFDGALRTYKERRKRPSFFKRTQGRRVLAATGDERCIPILAADYARAESPEEEVRHTIVATVFERDWERHVLPAIHTWREAHTAPRDAWLWYSSLDHDLRKSRPDPVLAAARGHPEFLVRCAALRAMADYGNARVLEFLPPLLTAFEDKRALWEGRQALLLELTARCLASLAERRESEAWQAAALAMLKHLDAEHLPRRSRYVVARCLAHVLGGDSMDLDKEVWIREVLAGGSGAGSKRGRYGPSFGGLRATGERIVYVIDFSDSMLTPLDERFKRRARRVITGPRDPRTLKERELPWDRINTRFDLARELLKASLSELDKNKLFAVVYFGDEAATLASTPSLKKATKAAIKKTIRELDAIKPGPVGERTQCPHGSLRGETNLHGGMRLAFRLSSKGRLPDEAYVSPKARELGTETIFLLTDGKPTVDNWVKVDTRDNESAVKDRESGVAAPPTPTLRFPGPYAGQTGFYLVDDVRRRNLFRNVEIHCLGMGEAQMNLLHRIAAAGLGQAIQIGQEVEGGR